jgi:wyosine [tRNA(Phe)-imidazoG37] synthetase (radical SAM superfamily)
MLHVLTGPTCNNNCLFCMESDRQGRQRAVASLEEDDVRAQIESYSGRDEILFTSGEPTLNPRLETYIRWAVQAGYRTIGVITNGRRLSYRAYALSLLSAGLNKLTVSIHGADAKTHDALTRARGSFAQTLAGLENIKVLRRGFPIDVHTSTVVVKLNLAQLPSIWAMLRGLGVDRVCLNVPMLKGRAVDYLSRGIARYSEVAASISGIAATLGAADLDRLVLADIPPCAASGVPAKLLRPQERFEQFEATGSLGVVDMARHEMQASDDPAAKRLLAVSDRATLQGKRAYYLTQRAFKDDPLRIRLEGCKRCIHGATCPGIWRAYVQRFGESEFVPIQGRET